MKKIPGHKVRTATAGILYLLLSAGIASAQDVVFDASVSKKVVEVGERFTLEFTVNARGRDFVPPPLGEFLVISGPGSSQSTSVQIINGKMTQSVTITYTYMLQAVREGEFTIAPATITVDKKQYQTQPVQVQVVKSTTPRPAQPQQQQTPSSTMVDLPDDELFVKVIPSTTTLYQGEYLVVTIKIFSRVDLSAIENVKFPSFQNFFQQEIEIPPLNALKREVVNGVAYGTGVIKQVLLFPQKSGQLVLDPVEIECQVRERVRRSPDDFFGGFFDSYRNVPASIASKPVTVTVKPYPEGAPPSFNGLTGSYTLNASIDRNEVAENEAVTLKLTFTGEGNLVLMEAPRVNFPPDFEVYDPRVTTNITNTAGGSRGTKTFEYLFIPRSAGTFRIPPVDVACFDPVAKSYRELSTPRFDLVVAKAAETESGTVVTGLGKEALKYIGKDIRFIKTGNIRLSRNGARIFGTAWFFSVYLLAFLVFILVFIILSRQRKIRRDAGLVKNRRAGRIARKHLRKASEAMKQQQSERFYDEVLQALWGYLSDKLNIPLSNLSRETGFENLHKYNIDDDLLASLARMIDDCEFARFAPAGTRAQLEDVYREAGRLISRLEQELR